METNFFFFNLITSLVLLAGSILFASYWLHAKAAGPWLLAIAVGVGAVGPVICMAVSAPLGGWPLVLAMVPGQIVCVLYHLLRKDRLVLGELAAYVCIDITSLPLCMADDSVWQYAIYGAVIALGSVLTLFSNKNRKKPQPNFSAEMLGAIPWYYRLILLSLPCAAAVPEILVLFTTGRLSAVPGMLLAGAFLLVDIAVFWLQYTLVRSLSAERLCATMSQWHKESRDYMNTIRAQRHDFNLHLHAITGLISRGRYAECQAYIEKLDAEAVEVNDIMPVHDAVIGSMLYNMREEARRRGSNIVYNITYDMKDIICNGFECNKIIGNLLKNAIDALRTPEDLAQGIRLDIFKRCGNTVIRTENRFVGDPHSIARMFEAGYSTKKGHEGIGLAMVKRTVEKYDGRVYPEFGEDVIRLVVNIPDRVQLQWEEDTQYEDPDASS